jgi:hypothetical protein
MPTTTLKFSREIYILSDANASVKAGTLDIKIVRKNKLAITLVSDV